MNLRKWLAHSVRNKLLAIALLPLLVVLPLLLATLALWSDLAYDRLLIAKVRSDLAVARGYFDQVVADVGGGTETVAQSHALHRALASGSSGAIAQILARQRDALGLDFLVLAPPRSTPENGPASGPRAARLTIVAGDEFARLAPQIAERVRIPIIATRNTGPSERKVEDRALVILASAAVTGDDGQPIGLLRGGVLLNQNLPFIDHINRIVYPDGALPFGSKGTATLFLDDVRITTNVRLFQDQRAVGTRVSNAVSEAVLQRGLTWLDSAFVVDDWYVSGYEPLLDGQGRRVGMLYVGYTERPFRLVEYAMLGVIGVLFLVMIALAAMFSLRLARAIFAPVETMNSAMRRVEEGDLDARVGPVAARDEVGALARHLDRLLEVIGDKTRSLETWAQGLDVKVAERTRELAQSNASLINAQQQLVKSEKLAAIGQLTASVAHEINNPIAVIQGNLDLIRETLGAHAAPVEMELRLLDEQVQRMRLIVMQLLQYARPTEYAGYIETLDVDMALDECLVLVAHLLRAHRIEIVKGFEATRRVGFNRQELQQVLINLVVNAIQLMPSGGRLTLRTRDWERGALIEIEDTGPGLSAEVMERLFRPFFTTRAQGNGLGLWISQGLVERYGGRIEPDNAAGGGAVFRVRLLAEPEAPPAAASQPAPLVA